MLQDEIENLRLSEENLSLCES